VGEMSAAPPQIVQRFGIQTKLLIINAVMLVAALAWNAAISEWFSNTPQLKNCGPWFYAVFVTGLAVAVSVVIDAAIPGQ